MQPHHFKPHTKMNPARLRSLPCWIRPLFGLAVVSSLSAQTAPAGNVAAAKQEEPVSLSVFEVTTSKDIGYQSTNAAEATRMNTPIENIPMNVTVFNQQFIEDLVATDSSQLLAYEASAV